jgi:hypothetical protein
VNNSVSEATRILVKELPPHLQMGLVVYLRQDLINNLNEEQTFPFLKSFYFGGKGTEDKLVASEKMLQILECLNMNNLIYKFSEVQSNMKAMWEELEANKKVPASARGVPIVSAPTAKELKYPVTIGFPEKELASESEEVLTILKERRKAISEFVMKILNSFKILDVSFLFVTF